MRSLSRKRLTLCAVACAQVHQVTGAVNCEEPSASQGQGAEDLARASLGSRLRRAARGALRVGTGETVIFSTRFLRTVVLSLTPLSSQR